MHNQIYQILLSTEHLFGVIKKVRREAHKSQPKKKIDDAMIHLTAMGK
jgi:hypothetical protein